MTKPKEIDELLKVLDMSEADQWNWLVKNNIGGLAVGEVAHLADLAFRLRDEIEKSSGTLWWSGAISKVYIYVTANNQTGHKGIMIWFAIKAQPIHWIIAALIAERLAEGKEDGKE